MKAQGQFKCSYDPINQYLEIKDEINHKIVLEHASPFNLWLPDNKFTLGGRSKHRTKVVPEINVMPKKNGFDIEYTFVNNTKDTSSMGEFCFGSMKLDSLVYFRNTTYTFQDELVHAKKDIQFVSGSRIYPSSNSYSPVTIVHDNHYIFGFSVVYPFQKYQHTINQLLVGSFFDHQSQGWGLVIQSNENINGQKYFPEGELAPGQTRVYKVFIRVDKVKNENKDWKKVIKPYRDYFRSAFSKMGYKRDRRPIVGYHGVSSHLVNDDNPYGYWNVQDDKIMTSHPLRPDHVGFNSTVKYLTDLLEEKSYRRIMYWAPTGLYKEHPAMDYPFQFMSQWFAPLISGNRKSLPDPRSDGISLFGLLKDSRYQLGFWWGHAIYVSRYWDSPSYEMFDPDNPMHWTLSYKEIDIAKKAGATCVGLDSFSDLPGWDQVTWLDSMINRTGHQIKFVSEIYSFDVVHTKAAFFYADWDAHGPHTLADYLVPKNEKWFYINTELHPDLKQYVKKWTKFGYNACIMGYLGSGKYPNNKAKS